MLWTLPLSFACGLAAWAIHALFPMLYEPGVLMCLFAVLAAGLLPLTARKGLLCTQLAPLFYGLIASVEDWYLFDFLHICIGNAVQLDMQLCGIVLFSVLLSLPKRRIAFRKRILKTGMIPAQKEG